MLYLSGAVRRELYDMPGTGLMMTPMMGNAPDLTRIPWAADTGCYSAGGSREFDRDAYLRWLSQRPTSTCLFATAPDVVGDAAATWERSRDVLPAIQALGYRAALVAQDGLEHVDWDAIDCLFVGGSTAWKLSEPAYGFVREAKRRGKWAHMGRVNSQRRLLAAALAGYDSADGTFLAFGPDTNLPRLTAWLAELQRQPSLLSAGGAQ